MILILYSVSLTEAWGEVEILKTIFNFNKIPGAFVISIKLDQPNIGDLRPPECILVRFELYSAVLQFNSLR